MTKKLLLFSLMICFLFSLSAFAADEAIKSLADKAETIVIGKIVEKKSSWDEAKKGIYTTVTVKVDEYLKGDDQTKTQEIRVPGGKVGDTQLDVVGVPSFNSNENTLLFLTSQSDNSAKTLVSLNNGKLTIKGDRVVENGKSIDDVKNEVLRAVGKDKARKIGSNAEFTTLQFPQKDALVNRAKKSKPVVGTFVDNEATEDWGWQCVWGDDFENDFPGTNWVLGWNAVPAINNGYTWGKTNSDAYGGDYSVWCCENTYLENTDLSAGVDEYANDTRAWMAAGPFDLSGCYSAKIIFKIKQTVNNIGGPQDWSAVGFSVDGVWFTFALDEQFFYTSTDGWLYYELKIEDVLGALWDADQVWVAFMFYTDHQNTAEGTFIDEVKIKKLLPSYGQPVISSVSPDNRSAGTGHSITINGGNFGEWKENGPESTVEFFGGFYWWDDTLWVPAETYLEFKNDKIVCDVPKGASSGKLRVRRLGEGVVYHDFNVPFGYIGAKWQIGVGNAGGTDFPIVPYKVNPFSCTSYNSSQVLADIVGSADTWNNSANAKVMLEFAGISDVVGPQFDGENTVSFAPINDIPYGTPSLTYVWSVNGQIHEADIVLSSYFPWSPVGGSSQAMITANFATNEFGNMLGLADLYGFNDQLKSMFGYHDLWGEYMLGDAHAVDLHEADIYGIQWIYGKSLEPNFSANPAVGVAPLNVQFVNTTISKFPIKEYVWNFGDGSPVSYDQNPTHVYDATNAKCFDVFLTVTDIAGNTVTISKPGFISLNLRVAAGIDAEPTVGYGPLTVQFTNRTSGRADSYMWDFGDGTTSMEENPVHIYTEPGVYSVGLEATASGWSHSEQIAGLIEVYDDIEKLGLATLTLVSSEGTTWNNEGWDNTIDGDTYHTTGQTNVDGTNPCAVFTFDHGFASKINKVRLMTDTGVQGKEGDWVTKFAVDVSLDGENFTEVGVFEKQNAGWETFSFEPVEALFIKLRILKPYGGWRQIGEFEVYEDIILPDISGSVVEATTEHIANGYDVSTVFVKLANANGEPVTGLPPSYFRISATGTKNFYNLVTETETPGTYSGTFSSLSDGEKDVLVRVGGVKIASSSLDAAAPVKVAFTKPELTKEKLAVHKGTECWHNEGWDKAVDGDSTNKVAAAPSYSGCFGIFKFEDEGERAVFQTRIIRGDGKGYPQQLIKDYKISVSTDGENFTELISKSLLVNGWETVQVLPAMARYIKLELAEPVNEYRQFTEFEVYTTPLVGNNVGANAGSAFLGTKSELPTEYGIAQNYPNPFNPETMIAFDLPEDAKVSLQVYNVLGQTIQTLVSEKLSAGSHQIMWNGQDNHGMNVASGVYFYKISAQGKSKSFSKRMKMTLVR